MVILFIFILIYSIAYLTVFVLAHQDANMIKPLTTMTAGMLILLAITALLCLMYGFVFMTVLIAFIIVGLLSFLFYLMKY